MCVVAGQMVKWETVQPEVDALLTVDLKAAPCLVTSTTAMHFSIVAALV